MSPLALGNAPRPIPRSHVAPTPRHPSQAPGSQPTTSHLESVALLTSSVQTQRAPQNRCPVCTQRGSEHRIGGIPCHATAASGRRQTGTCLDERAIVLDYYGTRNAIITALGNLTLLYTIWHKLRTVIVIQRA